MDITKLLHRLIPRLEAPTGTNDELAKYLPPGTPIVNGMVRIGPLEDGGYILDYKTLMQCNGLISVGIGNEYRFEEKWITLADSKTALLIDGTIGGCPLESNQKVSFINRNLGTAPGELSPIVLLNMCNKLTTLKVDIEGAEYACFKDISISKETGPRCIIMEFHDLHDPQKLEALYELLKTTFNHYRICHIHANSWAPTTDLTVHGITLHNFPSVLELTMVSTEVSGDMWQTYISTATYPVEGLDFSNNPNVPDIPMHWMDLMRARYEY